MLADVAAAPLADRPGMLLRLLGEALTRARAAAGRRRPDGRALSRGAPHLDSEQEREELDAGRRDRRCGALRQRPRRPMTRSKARSRQAEALLAEIRAPGGQTLMRERGIALLLALAALAAFYGLWLRPTPSLDPDADTARPTTAERRGNGYAGLFEWLQRSGVRRAFVSRAVHRAAASSTRRRAAICWCCRCPRWRCFTATSSARSTSGCGAATRCSSTPRLLDQPGWAARRSSGAVVEIESLTAIEFETRKAREARLDDTPLAQRVREADARAAQQRRRGRRRR